MTEVRIVVPTHNPGDNLRRCLARLYETAPDQHEIVIVDDSRSAQNLDHLLPCGAQVRRTGGAGSAAAARNLGAVGFTGRYLVFVDDDVEVEPRCLGRLLSPLRSGAASASVGTYSFDVRGHEFASAYKQLYVATVHSRRPPLVRNYYWTAIASVRADVFKELNGFDSRYHGASGEDMQFGVRLTEAGHTIASVPDARGRHLKHFTVSSLVANDWRKGRICVRDGLTAKGPISDNPHATARDVKATVLAGLAVGSMPFAAVTGMPLPLAGGLAACVLAAWCYARSDLGRTFWSYGLVFLCKAMVTMLLLDVVRLACAVIGITRHAACKSSSPVNEELSAASSSKEGQR